MAFHPFLATVARSRRISPNFQRVTFTGVDDMGPAGDIMDLRIKLIIPGAHGLPPMTGDGDWYTQWKALDVNQRGWMRTYSVRELRRLGTATTHAPRDNAAHANAAHENSAEIDIDFALHGIGTPHSGPAATFAVEAKPGDQLYIIAPQKGDESGPGIEFKPEDATEVVLMGDETALPAMLRIADEWPAHLHGTMYCELVDSADIPAIGFPDNLTVHWLARTPGDKYGDLLVGSTAQLFDLDNPRGNTSPGSPTASSPASPASPANSSTNSPADSAPATSANDSLAAEMIWETPEYSSCADTTSAAESTSTAAQCFTDTYFWIAGESSMVTTIRRMLVKQVGISRHQVSFMGYWKNGVSALG